MVADRTVRATSFGEAADQYDRYRPSPPLAAAEWLVPAGARRVVDLAAGTGGFSRVLAQRVDHVVGVELDLRMATVLASRSPGVEVVNGRGEALPVRTASLDAVLVSSAWHWLDPDVAVPEIARVLRPGGVLGVLWNGPSREPWVNDLLGRDQPSQDRAGGDGRRHRALVIPEGQPFSEPEQHLIDWVLPRTPAELVGLAGTYSRVITLAPDDRRLAAERVAQHIDNHPLLRNRPHIDLPMTARCWRAVRLRD